MVQIASRSRGFAKDLDSCSDARWNILEARMQLVMYLSIATVCLNNVMTSGFVIHKTNDTGCLSKVAVGTTPTPPITV